MLLQQTELLIQEGIDALDALTNIAWLCEDMLGESEELVAAISLAVTNVKVTRILIYFYYYSISNKNSQAEYWFVCAAGRQEQAGLDINGTHSVRQVEVRQHQPETPRGLVRA